LELIVQVPTKKTASKALFSPSGNQHVDHQAALAKQNNSDSVPILTAGDMRKALLRERSEIDYRRNVNSLTPMRHGVATILIQNEDHLLSLLDIINNDNALIDSQMYHLFNVIGKLRDSLKHAAKKMKILAEKDRLLAQREKIIMQSELKQAENTELIESLKSDLKKANEVIKATRGELFSVTTKMHKNEESKKQVKTTLKNLRAVCKRRDCTIDQIKKELKVLQTNSVLSKDIVEILEKHLTPSAVAFMKRLIELNLNNTVKKGKKKSDNCDAPSTSQNSMEVDDSDNDENCNSKNQKTSRIKYDRDLRSFALTLNFYSPLAYEYVRETFNNTLPAARTIRGWLKEVDCKPGITTEALNAISARVKTAKANNEEVLIGMSADEMSIRENTGFNGEDHVIGYVNTGETKFDDLKYGEHATRAFAFMAVGINTKWKLAFGYFLTNSL
jgi:Transposase protein